jgi:hypothetical protein
LTFLAVFTLEENSHAHVTLLFVRGIDAALFVEKEDFVLELSRCQRSAGWKKNLDAVLEEAAAAKKKQEEAAAAKRRLKRMLLLRRRSKRRPLPPRTSKRSLPQPKRRLKKRLLPPRRSKIKLPPPPASDVTLRPANTW